MQSHGNSHERLHFQHDRLEVFILRTVKAEDTRCYGCSTSDTLQARYDTLEAALVVGKDCGLCLCVSPCVGKPCGLLLQLLVLGRAAFSCGLHFHQFQLDLTQTLTERNVLLGVLLYGLGLFLHLSLTLRKFIGCFCGLLVDILTECDVGLDGLCLISQTVVLLVVARLVGIRHGFL